MTLKHKFLISVTLIFITSLFGCSVKQQDFKTFTIWTDREEFVSYAELFNSSQNKTKAIIIYKPKLINSLPPAKDEEKPDLIIGSYLKNSKLRKNFRSINGLLSEDLIDTKTIYSPLLNFGRENGSQYLLPVSFNIPLFIFATKNEKFVPNTYTLEPDQIRDSATLYNTTNKSNFYTKMGFAPSWNEDFIYTVAKLNGANFKDKRKSITWDNKNLTETIEYFKTWTTTNNTSTTMEQDFDFKYLYTPEYKQVISERCLYAYTNSEKIFGISYEQLGDIDFRWLSVNNKIPVRDNIVTMGIYKHAKKPKDASLFINWFFQEKSQKAMLERAEKMKLDSKTFGIAGGFSSLRTINEQVFPLYYRKLLGNLPPENLLFAQPLLPYRWESIKDRVILPYLLDATKTDSTMPIKSIEERLTSWSKQFD